VVASRLTLLLNVSELVCGVVKVAMKDSFWNFIQGDSQMTSEMNLQLSLISAHVNWSSVSQ